MRFAAAPVVISKHFYPTPTWDQLPAGKSHVFPKGKIMRYQTKYWSSLKTEYGDIDPAFAKHLRQYERRKQIAFQLLMNTNDGMPIGIEYKKADYPQWAFILPDASGDAEWRIQTFDEDGMIGHNVFHTLAEAAEELSSSYGVLDLGALDRLAATPRWANGIRRQEFRLQHARGLISWTEMLERMQGAVSCPA
jgi:hypothetical protein